MLLPRNLQGYVAEMSFACALDIVNLFSEEKYRGPNFVWKDFLKERMFTVTLNQVYMALSETL